MVPGRKELVVHPPLPRPLRSHDTKRGRSHWERPHAHFARPPCIYSGVGRLLRSEELFNPPGCGLAVFLMRCAHRFEYHPCSIGFPALGDRVEQQHHRSLSGFAGYGTRLGYLTHIPLGQLPEGGASGRSALKEVSQSRRAHADGCGGCEHRGSLDGPVHDLAKRFQRCRSMRCRYDGASDRLALGLKILKIVSGAYSQA